MIDEVSQDFLDKRRICIKVVQTSVLYFVLSIPEFAAFFFDHLQVTIAWRMPCLRRVAWPWSPKRSKNTEGDEGESWGFQLSLFSGIHQWSESGHCCVAWRKGCSKKRLILKSSSCSGNDSWVSWKILNLPMWRYLKDMTSWHAMVSNDPLPVRFPLFNLSWGWKGLRVFRPQMRALEAENHLLLFFNFFFQSLGFGWRFLFFANLVISYSCCPGVEVQTLQGVMQKSLVAQTCHRFLDGPELKTRISKVQHSVQQLMPKHHWMLAVWLWPQSLPEFSEDIQESNRDTPIFGLKCYKMI